MKKSLKMFKTCLKVLNIKLGTRWKGGKMPVKMSWTKLGNKFDYYTFISLESNENNETWALRLGSTQTSEKSDK